MEHTEASATATADPDEVGEVRRLLKENLDLREKLKRASWAATIWQRLASELAWKLDEVNMPKVDDDA